MYHPHCIHPSKHNNNQSSQGNNILLLLIEVQSAAPHISRWTNSEEDHHKHKRPQDCHNILDYCTENGLQEHNYHRRRWQEGESETSWSNDQKMTDGLDRNNCKHSRLHYKYPTNCNSNPLCLGSNIGQLRVLHLRAKWNTAQRASSGGHHHKHMLCHQMSSSHANYKNFYHHSNKLQVQHTRETWLGEASDRPLGKKMERKWENVKEPWWGLMEE